MGSLLIIRGSETLDNHSCNLVSAQQDVLVPCMKSTLHKSLQKHTIATASMQRAQQKNAATSLGDFTHVIECRPKVGGRLLEHAYAQGDVRCTSVTGWTVSCQQLL